jgi:ABC-type transport system involved in cytochrome c biogenesis permease subunit
MRSSFVALIVLFTLTSLAPRQCHAAGQSAQPLDWTPWRHLPVQDGGRLKPLDTLARETVQKITGRSSFIDPETGRKLDPAGLYLTLLFDWQGWGNPKHEWPGSGASQPPESAGSGGPSGSPPAARPHGMATIHSRLTYFEADQPDRWDRTPLIRVDRRLRGALGLDQNQEYISPWDLSRARVQDPRTEKEVSFLVWAGQLVRTERKKRSPLEESGLELADRLWSYQDLRLGQGLDVLPIKDNPDQQWLSVAYLLRTDFDDQTDPTGGLRKAKDELQKARAAYLADSAEDFSQATAAFLAVVTEAGPELGVYPRRQTIDLEVAYNRWAPFRLAWVLSSAAIFCLLVSMATCGRGSSPTPESPDGRGSSPAPVSADGRGSSPAPVSAGGRSSLPAPEAQGRSSRPCHPASQTIHYPLSTIHFLLHVAGLAALAASLLAMLVGFALRTAISGRAPVTNLYESVVFMALGTLVFGLVFGLLSRRQHILTAAVIVGTIALILADSCPTVLNPSLRPLQPVLRSNFWLAIHVITIMLGYAALAVAMGIGNVTLGYFLVGAQKQETIQAQDRSTYKSLKAGVLLLLVGTILGALWADYSWGRFWGWDPKEVWALITLLSYLAILHARAAGWVGNLGLAALSVFCFTWVVMAWYGVNFLNSGLHNYGLSGSSGAVFVLTAVVAQLLYVIVAVAAAMQRAFRLESGEWRVPRPLTLNPRPSP